MKSFDTNPDYEAYYKRHRSRAWVTPVIIGVATIVTLVFLVFAFIQKTEADKQLSIAIEMKTMADQQAFQAAEQKRGAEVHAEAMSQRIAVLEEQLKNCSLK
jgi:hypothetical protein